MADLARYADRTWNYSDVGATAAGRVPAGSHVLTRTSYVGAGTALDSAGDFVLGFGMQRSAGSVDADVERAELGTLVVVTLRMGPLRIMAPTRVVWVVDEPDRRGFAYGTLTGHPEAGEEAFLVERRDGRLLATITAFSRPARWYTRLGGPVGRRVQSRVTDDYLASLRAHLA